MTAQPPQSFPAPMPNPVGKAASAEQIAALAELLVQQWKAQESWAQQVLVALNRLVELSEQNKAALDAMGGPEPDPFSVRGLAEADADPAGPPNSPFIGGG